MKFILFRANTVHREGSLSSVIIALYTNYDTAGFVGVEFLTCLAKELLTYTLQVTVAGYACRKLQFDKSRYINIKKKF